MVLRVYPADGGREVRAGLLFVVLARRGIVMAGFEGSQQVLGAVVVIADPGPGERDRDTGSSRAPGLRAAAGSAGRLRPGGVSPPPWSQCRSQRLRAKAAVVHADGADEQRGVLCALLVVQPPAHAASVIAVSEEARAAEQTPYPGLAHGSCPTSIPDWGRRHRPPVAGTCRGGGCAACTWSGRDCGGRSARAR